MPYSLLDQIARLALKERKAPKEILDLLTRNSLSYSKQQLQQYVERFFTLFQQNQWKRERQAPSFHLDEISLSANSYFRFPILSHGFTLQ